MEETAPARKTLGRYQLLSELGRGSMGVVYLAKDPNLDRLVAAKILKGEWAATPEVRDRFLSEARIAAGLRHPNIIAIHDSGIEGGEAWFVMEYVDGNDVGALIRLGNSRPVPDAAAAAIILQAARGLTQLAESGIVHRDIKPGNLLLGRSGLLKITDFGIAHLDDTAQTKAGDILGTPDFMSPEQVEGKALTERSDVFSLGSVFYFCLTGRAPFAGSGFAAVLANTLKSDPAPIAGADPALAELCLAMLRKRAEDRPAGAKAVAERLQRWLADHGQGDAETPARLFLESVDPNRYRPAPPPPQSPRPAAYAAAQAPEAAAPIPHPTTVFPAPPPPPGAGTSWGAPQPAQGSGFDLGVTRFAHASAPSGFFGAEGAFQGTFFASGPARFETIRETLEFYRKHLNEEYKNTLSQAKVSYLLWFVCVSVGFTALVAGVVAMLFGRITEGISTAVASLMVFFIQKIFQQREDHYLNHARAKNQHLEYGNHWLMIIQSIESIGDPVVRADRQAKLVDMLTQKLVSPPRQVGV